jgi:hypothetical protein
MANQQQISLSGLCSIESSLPDMLPLAHTWLSYQTEQMDDSPGRLQARYQTDSTSLPCHPFYSTPIYLALLSY